jgi:hypothetical protein
MDVLNIFYQEPDPDRWFKFDRYPRRLMRRLVRGKSRPGGVMMIALELMRGLDKINIKYRFNDFKYAEKHPEELVCIIGKPQLLLNRRWENPILFGAGVFSHPIDCPDLFDRYPNVQKILVAGEWMRRMFEPYYKSHVMAWPVGIDTDKWNSSINSATPGIDFLIYEKILWNRPQHEENLIAGIKRHLSNQGFTYAVIKYGSYDHQTLLKTLAQSKAAIFLCEHETQGLAYQQILSTDTPVFAWDQNGFWEDPAYYPEKVKFGPVSSVSYWDEKCGMKFKNGSEFEEKLAEFVQKKNENLFSPREFIMNNLTLEICAQKYVDIVQSLKLDGIKKR